MKKPENDRDDVAAQRERERIRDVYRLRMASDVAGRYVPDQPGERLMLESRERAVLRMLRRHGVDDLSRARILEVGCGRGQRLADWIRWGARPAHVHGLDIMETFAGAARDAVPGARLVVGSADRLPYPAASFDIVVQFTVFTSILDRIMRQEAASEMRHLITPNGFILWYDFRYSNPRNPNVRGIGTRELRELFPGANLDMVSLTLLPPLARSLARISPGACRVLEAALAPLRSHYLAVIRNAL